MKNSTPEISASHNSLNLNDEPALQKELQALKLEAKRLNESKGKLSREIGQRKKSGLPFDHVLTEMKVTSIELKQLKAQQSETQSALVKLNTDKEQQDSNKQLIPAHIRKPSTFSSKPAEITVQLV